jgi:hypothetical protein
MESLNELRCHPDGVRTPTSHSPRVSDGEIVTCHSPLLANCRCTRRTLRRIASASRRSGTPSISSVMSIIVPPHFTTAASRRRGPRHDARDAIVPQQLGGADRAAPQLNSIKAPARTIRRRDRSDCAEWHTRLVVLSKLRKGSTCRPVTSARKVNVGIGKARQYHESVAGSPWIKKDTSPQSEPAARW